MPYRFCQKMSIDGPERRSGILSESSQVYSCYHPQYDVQRMLRNNLGHQQGLYILRFHEILSLSAT